MVYKGIYGNLDCLKFGAELVLYICEQFNSVWVCGLDEGWNDYGYIIHGFCRRELMWDGKIKTVTRIVYRIEWGALSFLDG